jgi:chemotaxis protein MotB
MMERMWNQQNAQLQATTAAMQRSQREMFLRQQEQARLAQERKAAELERQAQLSRARQDDLGEIEQMRRRVLDLDTNNRDLHTQLAQSQQETQLLEDQLQLLNKRLSDTANQLSVALRAQEESKKKIEVLEASTRRRGSATIKANSSSAKTLTAISIPGVLVRQDGDVVRLELPSDQIFMPQSATPNPAASDLLNQVAEAIAKNYPRQIIGVEGHTDSEPISNTAWRSSHQLSAAQALAIMDLLARNPALSTRQLSQAGHGPNYPVASNATAQGKARNRRVEIVIYPETVDIR